MKNLIYSKFRENRIIFYIFLLGLILRIIAFSFFASYKASDGYIYFGRVLYESKSYGRDRQFFTDNQIDSKSIEKIFNNPFLPILKRTEKEIILTASHPIGWPLQIAFLYMLFGNNNINVVLIYNILLSSFTILLFYLISKKLFNINIALIASLIAALNPIFILESVRATTETNFLFFLMLSIYFLLKSKERNKKIDYILFGAIVGFTSLIRPVAFLYFFIFLLLFRVTKIFNFKLLLSMISFIVVLSPWIIRNYFVFNSFIPMTNLSGIVFLQGNNKTVFENKTGSWISQEPLLLKKDNFIYLKKSEVEIRNIAFNLGLEFIKNLSFFDLIKHEWYKLRYGFGLSPKYFLYRKGEANFSLTHKIVYFPLFFLTLVYFLFFYKNSIKYFIIQNNMFLIIFISGIIVFFIQTLIFFGDPRYRAYLLDPFLIYPASLSINSIFLNLKKRIKCFE